MALKFNPFAKTKPPRLDDNFIDPRRELENRDYELMPKGDSSIANLDPKGFQKEVYYESDKRDDN